MSISPDQPHDGTVVLIGEQWGTFPQWRDFSGAGQNTKIITDDVGNDWILYHAIERKNPWLRPNFIRRPLMLSQVEWESGWPVIKYIYNSANPAFEL